VRDPDQYQNDLASPAGQELIRQLYENYCDRSKSISFWAHEIPDEEGKPLAATVTRDVSSRPP
jgi:hypothetical protein